MAPFDQTAHKVRGTVSGVESETRERNIFGVIFQ